MKNTKEKIGKIYCDYCGENALEKDSYYQAADGTIMCQVCGQEHLFIHNFTQYDEYPFIEHNEFNGGEYQGLPFKRIQNE